MNYVTINQIPSRLNLTLDDDFRQILLDFKRQFPLLKEVDLIKMAVSGYYVDHFVEVLDEETSKGVEQSRKEISQGKSKTFQTVKALMEDLNN